MMAAEHLFYHSHFPLHVLIKNSHNLVASARTLDAHVLISPKVVNEFRQKMLKTNFIRGNLRHFLLNVCGDFWEEILNFEGRVMWWATKVLENGNALVRAKL